MKNIITLSLLFSIVTCLRVMAQPAPIKNFKEKMASMKSIVYTSITRNDSPIGDNADTIRIYQNVSSKKENLQFTSKSSDAQEAYIDGTLLSLDLKNKFYTVYKEYEYANIYGNSTPLFKLFMITAAVPRSRFKMMSDTTMKGINCYHVKIRKQDTVIRKNRVYDLYDLYLNKTNFLPVYIENHIQGYIEKGGVSTRDVFTGVNRNYYSNYEINPKDFPNISRIKAPAGFISVDEYNRRANHKTAPLLARGIKAPSWKLYDISGHVVSSDSFKGKVLLLDFFGNYCAPCIFSIPNLNELHERYKNTDVKILSIDIDQGSKVAKKFAKKYKIHYDVCTDGGKVATQFNVRAVPTFYIIDKQGKVVAAIDEYTDDLSAKLSKIIDSKR